MSAGNLRKERPDRGGSRSAVKAPASRKRTAYVVCTVLAAVLVIAVAMFLRGVSDNKACNSYLDQARQSYSSSDFDSALAALRKAAAIEKSEECLMLMADCYEAQGNYDKALEVLRQLDVHDADVERRIASIESRRQALLESQKVTVAGKQFSASATSLVLDDMGLTSSVFAEIIQLYSIDSLSISGNSISDISQISQLGGLVTLNLSGNQVSDIRPLASLSGLRTLYLDNNPVTDLSPLYSLPNLTSLSIKGIAITESQLEALSKALPNCAIHSEAAQEEKQDLSFGGVTFKSTVTELDLSNMGLRDISALANCQNLIHLNLSGNEISDLSPLMNIPSLAWLDVSNNALTDLRPLMGIRDLYFINASGNSISSTTPLSLMAGVKELYLDSNPIRDFSGLRKLKSATVLGLSSTGFTDEDMSYVSGLSKLQKLYIEDNPSITGDAVTALQQSIPSCTILHSDLGFSVDLDGHTVMSDATELRLSGCGIKDIKALEDLSHLETVELSMNDITNIYILEYSESRFTIKYLDLSSNGLEDITALASLQVIDTLDLTNNYISSELPLMSLSTLRYLYIGGNYLSEEQISNLQYALPNCQIVYQ